jgi:tetratricopeptide (TPR) repeat protein
MDSKSASIQREARRLRALLAVEDGDNAQAENLLLPLLRDPEGAAPAVFELSVLAEQRGDTDSALKGYRVLAGTELEEAARQRSARLLCRKGARDAALTQLKGTASNASVRERLEQKLGRAELLADCGDANGGLKELAVPLKEMSGNSALLYQQAVLLERAGKTKESLAQFRTLQKDRPQDPELANALGFTLADHGQDLAHAEQLIRQALIAQPDNPSMLDSLGWVRFQRGAPKEALPVLERAWNLQHNGDIGAHWGQVLWSLGQRSEALAIWQKALRQDPDSDLLQKLLAQHPLQAATET